MATTKRYQSDLQSRTPQARNPFSYGQGISTPPPPNIPMPPRPSAAPPPPPHIYRPKTTPAEATARAGAQIASDLSKVLGQWGDVAYKEAAKEAEQSGLQAGLAMGGGGGTIRLNEDDTIYANAFNKGVMEAYKGRLRLDAKTAFQGYAINHPADVDTYDQLVAGYVRGTEKQLKDPAMIKFAQGIMGEYALQYRYGIAKEQFERARDMSEVTWNETQRELEKDLFFRIEKGEIPTAAMWDGDVGHVDGEPITSVGINNTVHSIVQHGLAGVEAKFQTADQLDSTMRRLMSESTILAHMTQFEDEANDGNADAAYLTFKNNDALDISSDDRKTIESRMLRRLKEIQYFKEIKEKELDRQLKLDQETTAAIGWGLYGRGKLTRSVVNGWIDERKLNSAQAGAFLRVVEKTDAEQAKQESAEVTLGFYDELFRGVDEGDDRDDFVKRLNSVIGEENGISGATGVDILGKLLHKNYLSVTKSDNYKAALQQIDYRVGKVVTGLFGFDFDDSTTNALAAAKRELYRKSTENPDSDPLDLVENIIARALRHIGNTKIEDPGLQPDYTLRNEDGSFNLYGSRLEAEVAFTREEITLEQFLYIFEQQKNYDDWEKQNETKKVLPPTTSQDDDAEINKNRTDRVNQETQLQKAFDDAEFFSTKLREDKRKAYQPPP